MVFGDTVGIYTGLTARRYHFNLDINFASYHSILLSKLRFNFTLNLRSLLFTLHASHFTFHKIVFELF